MFLTRVRAAIAALAAIVIAGVLAVPAQAAVGDIVTVSGTVVDNHGVPVEGQTLYVISSAVFQQVVTAADGTYSASFTQNIAAEYVNVSTAGIAGSCPASGPIGGATTVVVDCVVPTLLAVTFEGVATTSDGSSPVGQSIQVAVPGEMGGYGWALINADGSFSTVAHVPDTATNVSLVVNGATVAGPFGPFTDGAVYSGLAFTFAPYQWPVETDMSVTGRVLDKRGKPLAGASVELRSAQSDTTATTDAHGDYTVTGTWLWSQDFNGAQQLVVIINGAIVEYLDSLDPQQATVVNYRVGKTPVYEPFALGLVLTAGQFNTDVYRKVPASGPAEWYVSGDLGAFHFTFGSKKTELVDVLPINDYAGTQEVLLRDVSGGVVQWYRFGPDDGMNEQATFGYPKLDGLEYFDFVGQGGVDVVAWGDRGGQTTVWTWGIADGIGDVQATVLDGNFVSAHHANLNPDQGDELVVVNHSGQKYTVWLLDSSSSAPVVVSTGRGEPTVAYDDADGDGVFDIVVTYPGHTKHRHHSK